MYWSAALGGWVLTRYDDVLASICDTRHFSSRGRMLATVERVPADQQAQLKPLEGHFTVGLISADPPDHTRLRSLVNTAFAAQARPAIDIIRDLAYPLPAIVIAELLGAPPDAHDLFKTGSNGILSFQGRGVVTPAQMADAQTHLLEMRAFLRDLLAQRRRQPQSDLLSRLVAAETEGDRLTKAELMTTRVTLLTAGHETTTNLIGNGVYTLLRHPDQLHRLQNEPALLPTAIEGMLRFESPLQRNPLLVRMTAVTGNAAYKNAAISAGNLAWAIYTNNNRVFMGGTPDHPNVIRWHDCARTLPCADRAGARREHVHAAGVGRWHLRTRSVLRPVRRARNPGLAGFYVCMCALPRHPARLRCQGRGRGGLPGEVEAGYQVRRLRNHPCLALWCGNNENQWLHEFTFWDQPGKRVPDALLYDTVLPQAVATEDGHTPYWPRSPYGGNDHNGMEVHCCPSSFQRVLNYYARQYLQLWFYHLAEAEYVTTSPSHAAGS